MTDVIVALFVFALIFIAVTAGNWALAIIMGLIAVVMFMPTPDGIFYARSPPSNYPYIDLRTAYRCKSYTRRSYRSPKSSSPYNYARAPVSHQPYNCHCNLNRYRRYTLPSCKSDPLYGSHMYAPRRTDRMTAT